MRLGELLGKPVVTADGKRVGRVHDVRLVADGPKLGFGPALRVDGLVVGRGAVAIRLGYQRHGVRGPFIMGRLIRTLEGHARYVRWSEVAERGDEIRLRARIDELPRITDIG